MLSPIEVIRHPIEYFGEQLFHIAMITCSFGEASSAPDAGISPLTGSVTWLHSVITNRFPNGRST